MSYTKIGAAWEKEPGKISVKLNNGKWFTMFENTRKSSDKSPDWNLSMKSEDAQEMGLEDNFKKEEVVTANDEINPDEIPF